MNCRYIGKLELYIYDDWFTVWILSSEYGLDIFVIALRFHKYCILVERLDIVSKNVNIGKLSDFDKYSKYDNFYEG